MCSNNIRKLSHLKFKFLTLAGSSDGGAAFNSGPGVVSFSEFEFGQAPKSGLNHILNPGPGTAYQPTRPGKRQVCPISSLLA